MQTKSAPTDYEFAGWLTGDSSGVPAVGVFEVNEYNRRKWKSLRMVAP